MKKRTSNTPLTPPTTAESALIARGRWRKRHNYIGARSASRLAHNGIEGESLDATHKVKELRFTYISNRVASRYARRTKTNNFETDAIATGYTP